MSEFFNILPTGDEPNLCPHYESPEDDPEGSCLRDFEELGSAGECWRSWGGPEQGFVCPFTD